MINFPIGDMKKANMKKAITQVIIILPTVL